MQQTFVKEILKYKEDPDKRKALVTRLFYSSDLSSLKKASLILEAIDAIIFTPPSKWVSCDIQAEQEEDYAWYFLTKMNEDDELCLNGEVFLREILFKVDPVLFSLKIFDFAYEYNIPIPSGNFC